VIDFSQFDWPIAQSPEPVICFFTSRRLACESLANIDELATPFV
jgi:hypothetical protein